MNSENGKGMKPEESVDWEKFHNSKLWEEEDALEPVVKVEDIYIKVIQPAESITLDLEIVNGAG